MAHIHAGNATTNGPPVVVLVPVGGVIVDGNPPVLPTPVNGTVTFKCASWGWLGGMGWEGCLQGRQGSSAGRAAKLAMRPQQHLRRLAPILTLPWRAPAPLPAPQRHLHRRRLCDGPGGHLHGGLHG